MDRSRTGEQGAGQHWWTLGNRLAVVACLVISVTSILTPRPPKVADPGAFSVDRALEHVEFIATEPHVMGTPEIERVREYIVAALTDRGLDPETLTIEAPDYYGSAGSTVDVTDVLVRIPGTGDGTAMLLMAHYDTVPTTSGANDNAAAVAALLEVARILTLDPAPPNDVIILFTDGEEPTPRFGAWGFAEFHPWFRDVALAVNFEGISVAGPSMLVEANGPKGELVSRLARAVPDPVVFSFLTQTTDLIGSAATDFDVFRDRDVPGYNFAYMRGSSIYHTDRDSIASLNVDGLAHHGSLALGIAQNFGPLDVGDSDGSGFVFFTVPLGFVVQYSEGFAMVSVVAVVLLAGGAVWVRTTHRGSSMRQIVSGFALTLIIAAVVVAVSTLIWVAVANLRPAMGMTESYVYLAALILLAGGGWYVARRWAGRAFDADTGLLLIWLSLAVGVGFFLPPAGYLFVWPAIAAGAAELLVARNGGNAARLAATILVAATTFVVLVPAVDTFFHFASPRPGNPGSELPAAIAVSMLLAFLAIGLVTTRLRVERSVETYDV